MYPRFPETKIPGNYQYIIIPIAGTKVVNPGTPNYNENVYFRDTKDIYFY